MWSIHNKAKKDKDQELNRGSFKIIDPEAKLYNFLSQYVSFAASIQPSTNGLLGFFNGNTKEYGKVFRNSDGSSSTKKNQMKWALSHATTVLPLQRYGIPPLSKPVVHPGRIPMFTIKKIDFCKKMLLKLYRKQSIKIQQRFKTQMKSCLQDADSPSVAGSIGKVIRISRLQQQASVKALVKVVKRKIEKEKKEKMKDDDDE
jgi:hypothetical protein